MNLKNSNINIQFDISPIQHLIELEEDFCLVLDIKVYYYNLLERQRHIKTSRTTVTRLIKEIRKFIEFDDYEVELLPSEEDFYLLIKSNKVSKKKMIESAEKSNASEEHLNYIKNYTEEFRLILLLDNSYSGMAYIIFVTKEQLLSFINEFENTYKQLVDGYPNYR
jgi:hypothetical protein